MNSATKISALTNSNCWALPITDHLGHDLCQMVGAISWLGDELAEAISEGAERNELASLLSLMRKAVTDHDVLLNSFRCYLRHTRQRNSAKLVPSDLNKVARDLDAWIAEEFPNRQVLINLPTVIMVLSRESLLFELLQHLIRNATLHYHERASISLRFDPYDEGFVVIDVSNDGPAIPAHIASRLGMPFLRDQSTQKIKRPGLGLGIHLSARIADSLGHVLSYSRTIAEENCFSVRMACYSPPHA